MLDHGVLFRNFTLECRHEPRREVALLIVPAVMIPDLLKLPMADVGVKLVSATFG